MRDVYALLQRMHVTFQRVAEITERENNPDLLPTRFLMARAHAAWLAAVRLALSGQTVEAYPLVRVVVENAWYALHLAKDPNAPTRAKIWLCRDDDAAAEKRCATEFSITNVRATHAAVDAVTEATAHTIYKSTIQFGGHPNERGVLVATIRTSEGFGAVVLTDNPRLVATTLKTAVEAGVVALKTFELVFPERFKIMGIDGEIAALVGGLNTVFKQYV